jgi:cytidylate kinase
MAIVTISRGTFAGGARLAALLGQRLGYATVSREDLYSRVREDHNVTQEDLVQIMTWAPTRFDPAADRRRRLFAAIQASLCALLKDDDAVYHGHAGHLLLPDVSHVVRVRLIAPRAQRIEMAMERDGVSSRQASSRIDQVDSERARWTEFVFGANWADPSHYDLVLNLERVSLEEAAEIMCRVVEQPVFRATAASRRRLEALTRTSAALAHLLADPNTAGLDLKVDADDQGIVIKGLTDRRRRDAVLEVARRAGNLGLITVLEPET